MGWILFDWCYINKALHSLCCRLVLSGSPAGLDAPQAGVVFVGVDHRHSAAALTAERCWCEGQRRGDEPQPRHWPETEKEAQSKMNTVVNVVFLPLSCLSVFCVIFAKYWRLYTSGNAVTNYYFQLRFIFLKAFRFVFHIFNVAV